MTRPHASPPPVDAAEQLLGDAHPLVAQLGSTEGLVDLTGAAAALSTGRIRSLPELLRFLERYQQALLIPVELPVIHRAYQHTVAGETRELIALDRELADSKLLEGFAEASRRVGRGQLRRLRPLRDHRVVQRYLHAVDEGRAHGWHTIVYGVTLALYSLPLRQGLVSYGQQTVRGFVDSAARSLRLSEADLTKAYDQAVTHLPASVEGVLGADASARLEIR
jgi:urease accessory protein UreF